ncbi:MAG TPA: Ig-like domain-containing protein, partial [Actinoplanes sp.]|nr:Ig-like domain-containing protein [Actinoplanes sp.]
MRTSPYRVLSAFVIMALTVMAGVAVAPPEAQAAITTPFASRYTTDTNGAILIRGNTNMQCPSAATNCLTARDGQPPGDGEKWNNNGYNMEFTNADGDSVTTFNDSTAVVDMPNGSTVLFAGLYWGADTSQGGNGAAAPDATKKDQVQFGVPGGALATVTATDVYTPGGTVNAYQAFANVTSLVSGPGNGTYRVANIQAGTGTDRYAGWSLVIAYQNAAKPLQSLHVYDGFGVIDVNSGPVDITVSGFQTPPDDGNGTPVASSVGTVVYEGDLGKVGDTLLIDSKTMSDTANPADNFFNSTISEGSTNLATGNPAYKNQMGIDIDQFDATGKIGYSATQTTLRLNTSGETIYPGVVTFTTTLSAPSLTTVTTPTDVNAGDLLPGDIIEYSIDVTNNGYDLAKNIILTDAIPTGTTYVTGSMNNAGSTVADNGPPLTFNISSLARSTTTNVKFRVRVNDSTTPGSTILNQPNLTYYGSSTTSSQFNTPGDSSTVTVQQPKVNLTATFTVTPTTVNESSAPNTVNYTVKVDNAGADLEPHPIVTVDLPTGVDVGTLPGNCSISGRKVTCDLTAIAAASSGTVTFPATVPATTTGTVTATVAVTGTGNEGSPSDNGGSAAVTVNRSPVAKSYPVSTTYKTPKNIKVAGDVTDAEDPSGPFRTEIVTPPVHGDAVVNSSDQSITYTPDDDWRGTEPIIFRCYDPGGGWDQETISITTVNAAPTAVDDNDATGSGIPITVDVLANDTDPNSDNLTLLSVSAPQTDAGTTEKSGSQVVYTPSSTFKGTALFTYVVSDGQTENSTATATVRIIVSDGPPVAVDDVKDVAYAGSVLVDVLANDYDPNNDPFGIEAGSVSTPAEGTAVIEGNQIRYTAPTGFSGTVTFTYRIKDTAGSPPSTAKVTITVGNAAPIPEDITDTTGYETPKVLDPAGKSTDPNGDKITVTGTGTPGHGTVTRNTDGTITYTPDAGYTGTDTFTYTITDGTASATGTITITVSNAPPEATDDSFTVTSTAPVPLDVLGNDIDTNGDTLTITITGGPGHGTAKVENGKVTYQVTAGYHGTDTFTYSISDGKGGTDTATVRITIADVAPEAKPDAATTPTNEPVTINVLTNDTDANGDTLTLEAVTKPAHGTVAFTKAGLITYTPDDGYYGLDTFTYT